MNCTLQIDEITRTFPSLKSAMEWLEEDSDQLDRFGGLYMTAASNGEESNRNAWMAYGHHDDIDYPDEVWSVVPRRSPCRWTGRWWRIQRSKA